MWKKYYGSIVKYCEFCEVLGNKEDEIQQPVGLYSCIEMIFL